MYFFFFQGFTVNEKRQNMELISTTSYRKKESLEHQQSIL